MSAQPLFHPLTSTQLTSLAGALPATIIISGDAGSGLQTTADWLRHQVGGDEYVVVPRSSDGTVRRPGGSIGIEAIRELYSVTSGKRQSPLVVIVVDAETMTLPAQNAFLKLLEEPVPQVHFVLLTHHESRLLPTVLSRARMVRIRLITAAQTDELLDQLAVSDTTRRTQLTFIAEGKPALLTRLATDETAFTHEAELLRQARTFVQGTRYQKLQIAHALAGTRADAIRLVDNSIHLIERTTQQKKQADASTVALLAHAEQAIERLEAQGNVRLVLAHLALS